jgi:hypothetical protein
VQKVGLGTKAVEGLRPSFSAHVRWCEHGAPLRSCGDRKRLEGKARRIPHLAKNERDAPHFLYAALDRTACAALFKEPHEVQGTHETTQEIGDVGHPAMGAGIDTKRCEPERSAVERSAGFFVESARARE